MQYEVELKFRAADLVELRRWLDARNAQAMGTKRQTDRYFRHPARDFAVTDEALRVRLDDGQARLTYKGPKIDQATKTRQEIEIPFTGGPAVAEQLAELLTALGFREVRAVAKSRTLYRLHYEEQVVELAIDEVVGLGTFVELESAADAASLDEVRRHLVQLAGELNLGPGERRSYLELLLERQP
jgi:adenylate cyclase class 2